MPNDEIAAKLDRIIGMLESIQRSLTPVYQVTIDGPHRVNPSDIVRQ